MLSFPSAGSRFEEADIVKNRYLSYVASEEISFEKAPGSYDVQNPVYYIYAGDRKIASAALREVSDRKSVV